MFEKENEQLRLQIAKLEAAEKQQLQDSYHKLFPNLTSELFHFADWSWKKGFHWANFFTSHEEPDESRLKQHLTQFDQCLMTSGSTWKHISTNKQSQPSGPLWSRDNLITEFENKTGQQRAFVEFLRGICIDRRPTKPPNLRCRLPVLNQGEETTRALLISIASFLDFPVGRDLALMRQALENLRMRHRLSS